MDEIWKVKERIKELEEGLEYFCGWVRDCEPCGGKGGEPDLGACRHCGGSGKETFGDIIDAYHSARALLEKRKEVW